MKNQILAFFRKAFAFLIVSVCAFAMPMLALAAEQGLPIIDRIAESLNLNDALAAVLTTVLGMVFRLLPTKKPLSIAYLIAAICHQFGRGFEALGKLGDRVLPQELIDGQTASKPSDPGAK